MDSERSGMLIRISRLPRSGNRAAHGSLGRNVTDSRTLGGAGEAAVSDQGNARAQLGVAGDSFGGVEHLGHTGTLGSLIANDNGIAGLDLVRQDGVNGVLLAVERTGLERSLEHLARNDGVLDDRASGARLP